jgi:hypothetical protein
MFRIETAASDDAFVIFRQILSGNAGVILQTENPPCAFGMMPLRADIGRHPQLHERILFGVVFQALRSLVPRLSLRAFQRVCPALFWQMPAWRLGLVP